MDSVAWLYLFAFVFFANMQSVRVCLDTGVGRLTVLTSSAGISLYLLSVITVFESHRLASGFPKENSFCWPGWTAQSTHSHTAFDTDTDLQRHLRRWQASTYIICQVFVILTGKSNSRDYIKIRNQLPKCIVHRSLLMEKKLYQFCTTVNCKYLMCDNNSKTLNYSWYCWYKSNKMCPF